MSLLEAISPTVRELFRLDPQAGCRDEKHKVHAVNRAGRPLCGGGPGWKAALKWQMDIGPVTCRRCLQIMERK